jgi:drug/metabolite transporter (DMT)-like permease
MVAHFWTADEKLSAAKLVGVLAGFAGVAVLLGPDALAGMASHVIAQTACLGAALFYAVAGVYGRRFSRLGIAPITAATGQLTASAAMLFPVALAVDKTWTVISPDPVTWSAIGASALLSTALAFVLYFRVLGRFGATNLLLVTLLIPASATTLGFVFLGEHLSGRHVIGMAAIAIGLAVIDGRLWAVTRRAI